MARLRQYPCFANDRTAGPAWMSNPTRHRRVEENGVIRLKPAAEPSVGIGPSHPLLSKHPSGALWMSEDQQVCRHSARLERLVMRVVRRADVCAVGCPVQVLLRVAGR